MNNTYPRIDSTFAQGIDPIWNLTEVGSGVIDRRAEGLWLTTRAADRGYSNAQIADYPYPPQDFRWRAPLRMTVTARASDRGRNLVGTAGFGFWNHPFSPDITRLPRLPRAIWFFFSSPPSNMPLALGVPGTGWKATTIDATNASAYALIPFAIPLTLLMRASALYPLLWSRVQKVLRVSECALPDDLLAESHTYSLDWREDGATFRVDDQVVHTSPVAPRGKAGFVAWMDNQYAVATPQGELHFGLIPIREEQSLILEHISIERLPG